ncbi:MAG: hypothetical protein AAFY39_09765, partial [Pseudomonadota bacterium]
PVLTGCSRHRRNIQRHPAVRSITISEIEAHFRVALGLLLQVKVRTGWLEEAERYSEMGLDFRDGN